MGFFESDIVQEEAKKLFTDYQELMKLGSDYGKFDREGKKMFIKKMESLMDRYKVFMKRFELSEDFQAKMTVEQLKINEIEKNISKEINFNSLDSSTKTKDDQKEKFQYEEGFQLKEPTQFEITEDFSNTSEYYQADNYEKFVSLDLDINYHNNYLSNNNIFENLGFEKQFISSLIELIGEEKVEKLRHPEKENINQMDNLSKNQIINNFDLIDKSLENLLLNLSYNINQELFKVNLIKKMISKDSFDYLVGKNLMIKNPYPFVINFELNLNRSSLIGNNFPSIIFFNISTVELEFKNLNLSIQRNKINELKNQFQRLIKKETYWRQKEITLNRIR